MKKFIHNACDPMSFLTHFMGVFMGFIFLITIIISLFIKSPSFSSALGFAIFAISTILLYGASSYYHYLKADDPKKQMSRKLDHSMIYFLIAGSYAPVCLTYLPFEQGVTFMLVMFSIAILGTVLKIFWLNSPRILYTLLYLIMGWGLLFNPSAFASVPSSMLICLAIGGILYSIGAIIYIIKKPNFRSFGFHEIFHVFILLGTLTHGLGFILITL